MGAREALSADVVAAAAAASVVMVASPPEVVATTRVGAGVRRVAGLAVAACGAAVLLTSVAACDDDKKTSASAGRSEVVVATGSMPTAVPSAPASAAHDAPPPKTKRILCGDGELDKAGRPFPKTTLAHVEAPGAMALDGKITPGHGWTWINFFAAWCGPCKEEIPRLRGWEKKLAAGGTPMQLVFVSLDDDERQLGQFLASQPDTGIHAALWAKSGGMRDGLLTSLRIPEGELPQHALVDPSGKIRCVIHGAVDDGDYDRVASIVSKK